jgi:hypothetical protein
VLDLLRGGVDLLLALLTTTTQAQHQVEGGLLLDVVVRQGPAVLQLLAGEDQTLLVRGNSLLVYTFIFVRAKIGLLYTCVCMRTLDLGLDIVNGIRRLHLEGDSLPRKGLDEDLHLDEGLSMRVSICAKTRNSKWR